MKKNITKIIAVISIVCAAFGMILCAGGKAANGSFLRVFENLGIEAEYHNRNSHDFHDDYYDDFYDGFDDLDDFFNDFFEGGNNNASSL